MNTWIERNRKYITQYLLSIAVILIFKRSIQNLLFKLGNLFDFDSTEFKMGCIILVLIGFSSYMLLIYKRYIISKIGHLLVMILFTTYIVFRVFDNGIIYFPESAPLKYIDIVALFFLLHVILWIYIGLNNPNRDLNKKDFFINDSVYTDGEIENELLVQKLISSISHYKPKNSFSIGVNAEWGFGKSTFLNRFYTEYSKSNPETIMFWFRIWKNKGDKAIIDNFFKELSTNLKQYSGEIEDNIEKYSEAILNISPGELKKIITAGKDIFRNGLSLEEYYQNIQKAIQKIDRQIIIILDDLDRLEVNEILDTYKIIRTLSDFDNVIFLAGYDRNYLEKTLGQKKEKYINKIFQVEINLLPFDKERINELVLEGIKTFFPHRMDQNDKLKERINNEIVFGVFFRLFNRQLNLININDTDISLYDLFPKKEEFVYPDLKLNYKHFIRTHRDLKRFLNEFKFNLGHINLEDICLSDYVLFRLLTYKYRSLYTLVFENISEFIESKDYDLNHDEWKDSWGDSVGNFFIYDEKSQMKIVNKLEEHEYSKVDIQIIDASICALFRKKSKIFYEKNPSTISKTYYTNIYLRNGIVGGTFTYTHFKESWESDAVKSLIDKIKGLNQNIRLQAFKELKLFLFKTVSSIGNKGDFSKLIVALNQFEPNYLRSDFMELEKIIKWLKDNIKSLSSEDLKKPLINSNVSIGPIDLFLNDIIINDARKKREELYDKKNSIDYKIFPFEIENTKEILLAKFEHLLKDNIGYNIQFDYYTFQIDFIAVEYKIIISQKANKLFKEHFKKNFLHFVWIDFLKFNGEPEVFPKEQQTFKPNDFLCQIFSSEDDWKALEADNTNPEMYKQFRENGFSNYYDYLETKDIRNIIKGEDHVTKLDEIKKLMEAFIDNGYKPLNWEQYKQVT